MTTTALCPICSAANPPSARACGTCGAGLSGDLAAGFSTALPAGTALKSGLYTVGKVLGQGGFGITYLGSDARARRPVAVKEFFPYGSLRQGSDVRPASTVSLTDYTTIREKFAEEARLLARFSHPGIVQVYDAFQENNTAYMVMEYLRGRSLGKLIEERGTLPEGEAVDYITRAGEALEAVHQASLLHRDIKPDNLMLTDDGRVVLIDFGTARTFAAGRTGRMTTMVTPGYAPLEQYGYQVRFGAFTDVYALAATLYHLLTGQMPAPATDRASGVDLRPPHSINPAVSPAVSAVVMWALEMRIDRRPQTVRAFLDALATPNGAPEPVYTPAPPQPTPSAPERRRRPRLPALPSSGPYYVDILGDDVRWPHRCACCFEQPDSYFVAQAGRGFGPFDLFVETLVWEVPYCSPCLEHIQLEASHSSNGASGLAAAAPLAGLVLGGPVGLLIGVGGAAAVSLFGAAKRQSEIQARLKTSCVAVGPAVAYRGWYDHTHGFILLNRDYAEAFQQENADVLVM